MIHQEEMDKLVSYYGHVSEEEAVALHNSHIQDLSGEILRCFVCKHWTKRDSGDFVYHKSIPSQNKREVVCTSHTGVKEWYEKLLEESRKYLKEMEKKDEAITTSN